MFDDFDGFDAMAVNEELDRFREEWLREVRQQSQYNAQFPSGAQPVAATEPPTPPKANVTKPRTPRSPAARRPTDLSLSTASYPTVELSRPKSLSALAIYEQAVEAEAAGALDDALVLYRKAFKIDSNVDRVYDRSLHREHRHSPTISTLPALLQNFSISDKTAAASRTPAVISMRSITATFVSEPVVFQAEDDSAPVPIQRLPPEMIVRILRHLGRLCDYTSIEAFACVSRKARLISLEPSIWREMTTQFYRHPQISEDVTFSGVVDAMYEQDHRRALIEHPRVRFDGVYIAVCHYVRPGLSENAWVNITHLITYHRYLRFFPDGTVLSLLANDDNPSEIVHILLPSYRRNGFLIGSWALMGTNVVIRDLMDPGGQLTKYGFEMVLTLKSKPLGRWNKLELREYNTVRLDTGEGDPLPLRHERPFWFSRVRSYKSYPVDASDAAS